MPIIVDPNVANPTPPTSVTSPDGVVTATVDAAHAGVLLQADFSDRSPLPYQVRFERGDGQRVRSGDPAWSPGGYATAYDHEAPLDVPSVWSAVPIYRDGSEGSASAPVSVLVGFNTADKRTVWLKSLEDPSLSMRLLPVEPLPVFTQRSRLNLIEVPGSSYPAGSRDLHMARTTSFTFYADSTVESRALAALLDSTLLLQMPANMHQEDIYCVAGDLEQEAAGTLDDDDRVWTVPLTEIARPATVDAPLFVPSRSYLEAQGTAPTYAVSSTVWPTYAAAVA